MSYLIDSSEVCKRLKHEEETHMLPASKEAYARARYIIATMESVHVTKEAPMLAMSTAEKLALKEMPVFTHKCGNCDAMCIEDDKFCSQCGARLSKKSVDKED